MSMPEDEVSRRREIADTYYSNYARFLKEGDLGKASEFLWGAVSNFAYALALLDNKKLDDHAKTRAYLNELATSRKDPDLAGGITAAERMHANFYHNFMSNEAFEEDNTTLQQL